MSPAQKNRDKLRALCRDPFIEGEPRSAWFFEWLDGKEPRNYRAAIVRALAIREGRYGGTEKSITAEFVRSVLLYDSESGLFTWPLGRERKTQIAGFLGKFGYWQINICGRRIPAHRLAWLYITGVWPENEIDHLDGNRANNRFSNLRDVTHTVNLQNLRKAMPTSQTGLLGCHPHDSKFSAQIRVGGKVRHIGIYATAEEGHAAYIAAKRRLHEGCTI